jgi:formate hydrogenlyase subunit 3/multisubunit Na+/H+ antiporter MnhD subunit
VLTALSLVIGGLLLLGLVAVPLARRPAGVRVVHGGCMVACLLLVVLAAWALLAGGGGVLALPFGPPWGRALLALDGLSAWFLLLLGVTGAIASLYAMARRYGTRARP